MCFQGYVAAMLFRHCFHQVKFYELGSVLLFSLILPLVIRGFCSLFHVGGEQKEEDWSIFGFLYGTVPPAPTTVIYAAAFGMEEDLVNRTVYM